MAPQPGTQTASIPSPPPAPTISPDYRSLLSGSSGFADLDQAVENMMRGAVLPPFPSSMTSPEIEVSVTIRFGLTR
jgi:hypothetical protein